MLLWLWGRLPIVAPVQPLAWELPYAAGAALKKRPKKCGFPMNFTATPLDIPHIFVTIPSLLWAVIEGAVEQLPRDS